MEPEKILKSFGVGLSRALRYTFPGFLFTATFAFVDRSDAIAIFEKIGWQLTILAAIFVGIGIYSIHRRLIIPCHHALGCLILRVGDLFCGVDENNSLSPTRWFGSLNPPVPRGRRMLAYSDLRRLWFNQEEEKDEVNVQHAESGMPVMISEAITIGSFYLWRTQGTDPIWSFLFAFILFFLSALSGMQEHRIECAHFKTDVSRAQQILSKFRKL